MSLRGSETTEAISQRSENKEIAALPPVARNDKPRIMTQSLKGEGTSPLHPTLQVGTTRYRGEGQGAAVQSRHNDTGASTATMAPDDGIIPIFPPPFSKGGKGGISLLVLKFLLNHNLLGNKTLTGV